MMVIDKGGLGARKIGGHFLVFQNKVISKKTVIILGGHRYVEIEKYFA